MIIILGVGRSGTSWLAKILDSHPDTVYRHEPDSVVRNTDLPFAPEEHEVDTYREAAARYLDDLLNVNEIKVRGSYPVFDKSYRGRVGKSVLQAWIIAVKGLQVPLGNLSALRHAPVPDMIRSSSQGRLRYVMKSVSSMGRATLFARAKPDAKIVHIVRHPCGVVGSALRGQRLKLLGADAYVEDLAETPEARRHGLTLERLQAATREEQIAARWVVRNERPMIELADHPNYRLVVYEDLCQRPFEVSRDLFGFCGLSWDPATERFLQQCVDYDGGRERYFQTVRSPIKAANKWKQELSQDQVDRIMAIAGPSKPGALFAEAPPVAATMAVAGS